MRVGQWWCDVIGEPLLDVTRELLEVVERLAKQLGDEVKVDIEIAVHEHVAEAGDPAEAFAELRRHHVRFHQAVDDEP